MNERLTDRRKQDEDEGELKLRPQALAEFIGQERARANHSWFPP
jgi:Holliday junction DNA helicase RuvB